MDDAVLLVLDVQKDFTDQTARMPVCLKQVEPMIATINRVTEQAQEKGMEIIYIGNEFERNDRIANWFRNYAAIKGQPGTAFDERLKILSSRVFFKNKPDALSNLHLREFLAGTGKKHIIIAGLFAEGCVAATAISALQAGYRVSVLQDATAGKSDRSREKALVKLARRGVAVTLSQGAFGTT